MDAFGQVGLGQGPLAGARPARVLRNLTPPALITEALRREEAALSADGALAATTGRFTGRSPKDKFFVAYPELRGEVDWGAANQPLEARHFAHLLRRAVAYVDGRELFAQDLFAGADPEHRLRVRVVTEQAWHSLFARNMFIRPAPPDLAGFQPDWTVLQLPGLEANPVTEGTNSTTVIAVDARERLVLIAGTAYAGEAKKSIFTVLNLLLPPAGVLPMHCSANVGPSGRTAIFFGLSGTGKTTLSADPGRTLVGDDEHGWGERGVFNFEGGCYAKVVRLDRAAEPEIFAASTRFGAVLENVVLDGAGRPLFEDDSLTENTRGCYPLDFIPNASPTGRAGHPADIVMLTADAFGVLPPISRLDAEQAMYHFLSGYTARLAGTERGVAEPQATFSACFGAPFMPRRPSVYAEMLGGLIRRHGARCWLLNTGWTGGGYGGAGRRMPLQATRALLRAALDGGLDGVPVRVDPVFGLRVPEACPGTDPGLLDPRRTWAEGGAYDEAARRLAQRFEENFRRFEPFVGPAVQAAGIRAA
jgi:phosphoenolpyruvate carboxykinase (ATP)